MTANIGINTIMALITRSMATITNTTSMLTDISQVFVSFYPRLLLVVSVLNSWP